MKNEKITFIAKTLAGLEEVLGRELTALGAENVQPIKRAVKFDADVTLMYKANMWCRTALSILKPLFEFTFSGQQQYYDRLREFAWDEVFTADKTISINALAFNAEFTNTHFLAQRTKDAVVDYFKEKTGKRPSVDIEDPQIKLNIFINGDQCSVSLDSSGAPLFKRGYRRRNVQAPLNEVLGAGLIMLSGWDVKKPFYDPMCGSGTFSIEAGLMALNMAPSLFRSRFAFQHWQDYDPQQWESIRQQAREAQNNNTPDIFASDINNKSMDAVRHNLMEAGLLGKVKLEKKDFFQSKPAHKEGMVIINPPYGRRLESDDIQAYYQDIGTTLKHFYAGFSAWIISPDKALTHKIGLRHSSQRLVYNGPIECRFLGYELYAGTKKVHKGEDTHQRRTSDKPAKTTNSKTGQKKFKEDRPGFGQRNNQTHRNNSQSPQKGYKKRPRTSENNKKSPPKP